jgi:hypothetical protein
MSYRRNIYVYLNIMSIAVPSNSELKSMRTVNVFIQDGREYVRGLDW